MRLSRFISSADLPCGLTNKWVRYSGEKGDPDNKAGDQLEGDECSGGTRHRLLIPPTNSRHIPIPVLKEMTSADSFLQQAHLLRITWPCRYTRPQKPQRTGSRPFTKLR